MATIIRRGDKHIRDSKARYTCGKCDSEIEFTKADVKGGDQRDGDYVQCPVCNAYISYRVVFNKK